MRSLLLAVLLAGCGWSAPCPCGRAYEHDPWNPLVELDIPAQHNEAVHCFCRCGVDGPLERLAPSLSCEAFEGICVNRNGDTDSRVCD